MTFFVVETSKLSFLGKIIDIGRKNSKKPGFFFKLWHLTSSFRIINEGPDSLRKTCLFWNFFQKSSTHYQLFCPKKPICHPKELSNKQWPSFQIFRIMLVKSDWKCGYDFHLSPILRCSTLQTFTDNLLRRQLLI